MSRRRPAVAAALALIVGILLHQAMPAWPLAWISMAAGLALAAILYRGLPADLGLAGAMVLVGLSGAQLRAFFFSPDDIAAFVTEEPRPAELELRIEQPPRLVGTDAPLRAQPRMVSSGRLLRIHTMRGWQAARGTVLLSISEPHPRLAQGQTVRAMGMLQRPAPAMNPGQFDWADYYRRQRVLARLSAVYAGNVTILETGSPGLLAELRRKSRQLLALGFDQPRALDHALLRALLLGDADPQLRDVQRDFMRTGTSHHLAISGMHVALLGGLVYLLCRVMLVAPRPAAWVGLIVVVIYGLAALPSAPVVRSVVLCALVALGILRRRSLDGIHLLALTALLMLLYQPLDLYNAGFQLSFGTVLGLMLFSTPLYHLLSRHKTGDEALMQGPGPTGPLGMLWHKLKQGLWQSLAAGLVAWLVSAPIICRHFDQLNPYAVVASLLMAIPVLGALIGGFAKVLLTLILPSLAPLWASLAAWPVALMRQSADWLARLPGSDLALPALPLWLMALYYLLLTLPLFPWPPRWRPQWRRLGPALACATVLMLPLLGAGRAPAAGEARFTLLAVGAGQCALLETPSGKRFLFDAGSTSVPDAAWSVAVPFLRSRGIGRLDGVFVSHADGDHINALAGLSQWCDLGPIYANASFAADAQGDSRLRGLMQHLETMDRALQVLSAGRRLVLDDQTTVHCLWPPGDGQARGRNDGSLVLRIECRGRSILLGADIQEAAHRQLLAGRPNLRADALVAPHHGVALPSSAALLAAVDPAVVLCSNKRVLSRAQRRYDGLAGGRLLYRTHQSGAITLRILSGGLMQTESFR